MQHASPLIAPTGNNNESPLHAQYSAVVGWSGAFFSLNDVPFAFQMPSQRLIFSQYHQDCHVVSFQTIKDIVSALNIAAVIKKKHHHQLRHDVLLILCVFTNEGADEYTLPYGNLFGPGGDDQILCICREAKYDGPPARGLEKGPIVFPKRGNQGKRRRLPKKTKTKKSRSFRLVSFDKERATQGRKIVHVAKRSADLLVR